MKLARGGSLSRAVSSTVDHHVARAADSLPTIMVEGYRSLALFLQPFVEKVEHLEKGIVGADVVELVFAEGAGSIGTVLAPDLELDAHYL
jgi:hypothetical protein